MKTSNKLLILTGVLLLSSIFISAFGLQHKLINGDYTLWNHTTHAFNINNERQQIALDSGISEVLLRGPLSGLDIHIQYDTVNYADLTKDLPVSISQEGETLRITYNEETPDLDSLQALAIKTGSITIHLRDLKRLSNEGTAYTEERTNFNTTRFMTVYYGYNILVEGFQKDRLQVEMLNAGSIEFKNLNVNSMELVMDGQAKAAIDHTNHFNQVLSIKGTDWTKFELSQAHTGTLQTDLQSHATVSIKGNE